MTLHRSASAKCASTLCSRSAASVRTSGSRLHSTNKKDKSCDLSFLVAGVGLECRAVAKQRVITEGVPQSQNAVRGYTTEVTTLQRATTDF